MSSQPSDAICMVRPHMHDLPRAELPAGYQLRTFGAGDEEHWLAIEQAAERKGVWDQAMFLKQFGTDLPALRDRCFFVIAPDGRPVGTSTAWYENDFHGRRWGRVHWVAIVPEFQGRGLARPLMSATMDRLARSHSQAYLNTHAFRLAAVKLYLNYGFRPLVREPADEANWRQVRNSLSHALLDGPCLTPGDL